MRRTILTAALVAVSCAMASPAAAQWVRVESPNFVVFGEAGEARTREYAAEFERFREAIGRIIPGVAPRPAVPAIVFLFKDKTSFAPYQPLYQGKPVDVAGYFAGGASLDVIMMPASSREAGLRTIFHEYSHLVTSSISRGLPPWLAEGLAEYYSTFEVRSNGRRAMLGGLIPSHLALLNRERERTLSLEQLVGVAHDSPLYNEGSRRSMFYAQSWALVHMLLNGNPDRTEAFSRYVALTHAGRPALEAWQEVFGGQKLDEALRRYVRQSRMRGYLFTFDREIPAATITVSRPTPGDVHAALGDLRLQVEPETAAAHITADPEPATPYAHVVRGLLKLAHGHHSEALALLARGARESDDWLVQYRAAVALERVAAAAVGDKSKEASRAGEAALAAVLRVKPELPHAVALQGLLAGPSDTGVALLSRARELSPGRDHYTIWLAQFHSSRGEFVQARGLLAPLLSPMVPSEIREYARAEMGRAVMLEAARRRSEQQAAARAERAAAVVRSYPAGLAVPVYRELRPGEQRIEATFERVECPREGVILHVRSGGRALRFISPDFKGVELLSHRVGTPPPVRCGPRPPNDVIYLTWRPAPAALDGVGVGVELRGR
jgi:hypothetical protein